MSTWAVSIPVLTQWPVPKLIKSLRWLWLMNYLFGQWQVCTFENCFVFSPLSFCSGSSTVSCIHEIKLRYLVILHQKCRIQVRFAPTLNDYDVRQEALRIHTKNEAIREEQERLEAERREKLEKEANAVCISLN